MLDLEGSRAMEIFLSYRITDGGWAAVLIDAKLTERYGEAQVFRSSRAIEPGVAFPPEIEKALQRCSVLLAIIGPAWLTISRGGMRRLDEPGDYVRREVAFALRTGRRVIPVLLGDTNLPGRDDLPVDITDLADRQYVRLPVRNPDADLDRLVDDLAKWLPPGLDRTPDPARDTQPASQGTSTVTVLGDRNQINGPVVGHDLVVGRDYHSTWGQPPNQPRPSAN
jgi:hypothetical protein